MNLIENNNKFSKAVSQENDKSFVQQLQSEQIIAESCRKGAKKKRVKMGLKAV